MEGDERPSGVVVIEEHSGDEMINGVKYEEEKPTHPGLFNQLITNLVSSSPRQQSDVDGGEVRTAGTGGEVAEAEENGGNVMDNVLSEDTAPATDEASILIHSIIHD